MAFTPQPDRYYRLYFKHSGHCLDAHGAGRGEHVRQAKEAAGSDSQLWQFRPLEGRHYAISSKKSGRNFDVAGETTNDGAVLLLWDRADHQWNQHYRVVPAGDGSYYLTARHSSKRISAKDKSKDEAANVVQWSEGGDEHFRFRIVPEGVAPQRELDRDFMADTSAQTRSTVLSIIGGAPEVGKALAALTAMLWPADDTARRIWEQMKRYVQELVREMVSRERLDDLVKQLDGLYSNLAAYNAESYGSPLKAGYFSGLLVSLNNAEPYFFDERDPEKVLPYFVQLGSLRLAVLLELCLSYKKIYGKDDDKAAEHLTQLRGKIDKFGKAATKARERALDWRVGKVRVQHDKTRDGITTNHHWSVVDDYDGYRRTWSYNDTTSADKGAEGYAYKGAELRRQEVRTQYAAELDMFFGPARLWRYIDPAVTERPKKIATDILTGPHGGVKYNPFQDGRNHGRISAIDLYAGDQIDGIEVHYDGKPGGLHGGRGGRHQRLDLAADESIVSVWGRIRNNLLGAVYFQTSKGRTFGGGIGDGHYAEWIGDPPEGSRAVLHSIGGLAGTAHIEALSFTWRYEYDE